MHERGTWKALSTHWPTIACESFRYFQRGFILTFDFTLFWLQDISLHYTRIRLHIRTYWHLQWIVLGLELGKYINTFPFKDISYIWLWILNQKVKSQHCKLCNMLTGGCMGRSIQPLPAASPPFPISCPNMTSPGSLCQGGDHLRLIINLIRIKLRKCYNI